MCLPDLSSLHYVVCSGGEKRCAVLEQERSLFLGLVPLPPKAHGKKWDQGWDGRGRNFREGVPCLVLYCITNLQRRKCACLLAWCISTMPPLLLFLRLPLGYIHTHTEERGEKRAQKRVGVTVERRKRSRQTSFEFTRTYLTYTYTQRKYMEGKSIEA